MNLGTSRIVIIVALVAAGAFVLVSGFDDSSGASGASPTTTTPTQTSSPPPSESSSPSGEPATTTPPPQTTDVLIAVMNGTDVANLAQDAQDMLTSDGYVAPDVPTNAPTQGVQTTTVYYRKGDNQAQNKSDATYLAETYFPDSKVDVLGPGFETDVSGTVTIVVVVGQDYADAVAA